MSILQQTWGLGATSISIGTAGASVFPFLFKSPQSVGGQMKITAAGAGTLMILPQAISGATVGGSTALLQGYPVGAAEIITWEGPAMFYLQATGATVTIAAMLKLSEGCTLA